jgi:membrane protease YdiL (CAAX protease family)
MNRSEAYDPRWNKIGRSLAAQAVIDETASKEGQYSLAKIFGIWAAAALPMAILGWIVAPMAGDHINFGVGAANNELFARAVFLTGGLIWQFVLAMAIVYGEEGDLRWSTIRHRCWLNAPRDPQTGEKRGRLWLMVVPFIVLVALIQMSPVQAAWDALFPFLGEPERFSFQALMESDERKAALEGAWQVLGVFVVLGVFNTILGEELLFRGILLPKMRGAFGKADWVANGLLFGVYHLHQPWTIFGSALEGIFCLAFPSRRYRSSVMGMVMHSGQTVFFIIVALGLVLGLA